MKIPTLLGIAVLIAVLVSGGLYYFYFKPRSQISIDVQVTNLQVVNITNTSASIVWQTSVPVIGQVLYGSFEPLSQTANDNRDREQQTAREIHFVTINGLSPNSKYVFKVKNDSDIEEKASEFTTAKTQEKSGDELSFSFIKPLKGTILNSNLNPVDESLIFLTIPGAQPLATFSSTAGNFILSLKTVLNRELDQVIDIPSNTPAEITAMRGGLKSNVKIMISENNMNLPPIPLGANLDLENFEPQPLTTITFNNPTFVQNFDFNNDSKVNSLDLAILREATNPKNAASIDNTKKFDLNLDGIVDQKDIDIFSKKLTGN